jgi:hypothetical protein
MSKQQLTPPESDVLVQDKNTWQPPSTDVEVKKKSSSSFDFTHGYTPTREDLKTKKSYVDLESGFDKSGNGSKTSQPSPQNIELSNQLNSALKAYQSHLSPEEKKDQSKVEQAIQNRQPDRIRATTKDEQDSQHAMDTTMGKVGKSLTYLGSKTSKGAVQIAKGGAWVFNHLNTGLSDTESKGQKDFWDKVDKITDFGITKGQEQQIEGGKGMLAGAVKTGGMMAEIAPSLSGGEFTQLPKTFFALQGLGQGKETIDAVDPDKKLHPLVRDAFVIGSGAVNGLLMGDLGENVFGKMPAGLRKNIVTDIVANAMKEGAGKELTDGGFKQLLNNGAKDFAEKFQRFGVSALSKYNKSVVDLSALNAANFALKKGVDATTDKPVFNESTGDLAHNIEDIVTKQAPLFAAIGAVPEATKLLPYSNFKNDIVEHVINNPNDAENIKAKMADLGQKSGWTPEEIQATNTHVDQIAEAAKKLPENIKPEKRADGVQLLLDRDKLQGELTKEQSKREGFDESVKDIPSKQEEYLTDKVDQANDKLRSLVTGKPTTYSKGVGEEEGKFFKTTDGKKEEITESRYNLENLERTSKQQQNENNENAQKGHQEEGKTGNEEKGIPTEEKESNVNKVGAENVPTITKEGDISHAIKEGDEPQNSEQEHQRTTQWENIQPHSSEVRQETGGQTGGSDSTEPKAEKPRFKIKGDVITPLPPEEHEEANSLLQELHGITIKDIEDEQQERNTSSEATAPANADEKGIQQPANDGVGDAGKTPTGEAAQGKEEAEPVGIRNKDVEKERDKSVDRTHKTKEEIDLEGKRLVDSGELHPDNFAQSIIDNPRPATAEEQAALLYHKTKLKNKNRQLAKDLTPENQVEFARNEDLIEQNRKATEIIGNETGRTLGSRTEQMLEDYSRISVLNRAKMAQGGELSPKDEAELTERTKRIEELEGQLADREEEIRKLQEGGLVGQVHKASAAEARAAKREVTKAALRKEREGLLAELHVIARKSMKSAGANKIPVEMIVPLTKLARNYVLDGMTTLSGVADKIYTDLKEHVEGLKKEHIEDILKEEFPKYLDEQNLVRLGRAKKLQQTKLEKLKEQQESGNFEKRVLRKIQVDNDYLRIRAEINREQQRINKKIQQIEDSQKSFNRKIVDIAVKYGRQAKLASISVLGKLSATGLATIGLKPVTEGIGKGVSAILPKIAKRSSVEGSVGRSAMKQGAELTGSVGSLSQAYGRAFTLGMQDAYQELIGAGSNLSNLYKERGATLPSEAKEFFGHLHSAIKAPIKRFAWEHSYAKRVAKTIQNGLDPLDPIIDAKNRIDAYKDGDKAIFMGDNQLSKVYENAVGSLERSNSSSARTAAAAMRILLPFVKVPTNIVLEGAKYSFGLASGVTRLGRALIKGMDNLTPEEADTILEHLKKGSIGGAAMLIGFYNPKNFGGFYQQGKKGKVPPGDIEVDGIKIPAFLVEHPIFIAAQVGANFRQLLDKYRNKDERIPVATLATLSGLGYEVPQANEIKRLVDLTGNVRSLKEWQKFLGQTIKGEVEPAAIQQIAQWTDPKEGADTLIPGLAFTDKTQQKRKPETKKGMIKYIKEDLETGIPGLRQNVKKGK